MIYHYYYIMRFNRLQYKNCYDSFLPRPLCKKMFLYSKYSNVTLISRYHSLLRARQLCPLMLLMPYYAVTAFPRLLCPYMLLNSPYHAVTAFPHISRYHPLIKDQNSLLKPKLNKDLVLTKCFIFIQFRCKTYDIQYDRKIPVISVKSMVQSKTLVYDYPVVWNNPTTYSNDTKTKLTRSGPSPKLNRGLAKTKRIAGGTPISSLFLLFRGIGPAKAQGHTS